MKKQIVAREIVEYSVTSLYGSRSHVNSLRKCETLMASLGVNHRDLSVEGHLTTFAV